MQPGLAVGGEVGRVPGATEQAQQQRTELAAIESLDLLRRLRRSGVTAPALVLTALGTVSDRVAG
jgi:two-component system response regulator QseB